MRGEGGGAENLFNIRMDIDQIIFKNKEHNIFPVDKEIYIL